MKINYKKSLKLITLLITSILIATVSASTYSTMFMHATNIGVEAGNQVFFVQGSDWPGGTSSLTDGNQTATLDGMKGKNGTATIIEDPVSIYNNDTSSRTINLKFESWDGESETELYCINVTLYNDSPTGGTKQGQTIYLVPGAGDVTETTSQSIGSKETWRVEWVIYWKTTATTETINVDLELEVS